MRARRALLLGASTLVATAGWAQEPEEAYYLGEIRIDSSGAQSLLGNSEITTEELEDRNAGSMAEVFDGQTQITSSGGAAIGQKVFVQGIEESLLSVTIDGARQNKSAFHHAGNVLMDPAMLKRVEISAGLAPADAGPGGLGGSIAYETKDARDFLEPGDDFGGMLSYTYSTNENENRGTLAAWGRSGGFEYLLSGTRDTGDDYVDGDGNTIDGTGPDLTDYLAKLAFNMEGGGRLEFSASQTTDDGDRAGQEGPFGLYFARPDFAGVVGRDTVFIDAISKRTSYTLTYTDEQPDGWLNPEFQLSYNEQEMDVGGVEGINTSLSGTIKNVFDVGNGTVTAGLDFFHDTAEGWTNAEAPYDFSGEESLSDVGVFAQARQDLSDRVSVSYGARADFQTFEGADGSTFEESGLSANGTIDVILTDTLTFNAGLATTWGGFELGEAALINYGTDWYYDGLKPSRSQSGRVGLRYLNGPWEANAAYFETDIDNVAAVLPTSGYRSEMTDIDTRGVDASLAYVGTEGYLRFNYTYADVKADDATIATTAYYLGRPVGHLFGIEGAVNINSQFRIGGTADIALENTDTEDADAGIDALPGYEVVNLFGEYRPEQMDNLTVRLDIRNLFNQTYASRSSDGIGLSNIEELNEPGRSFNLTARIMF
ncbi:TonB-dependent receptor domain-containing protein [Tropicimonas sediminicola]|uniref:Hemoglobin/transferrin/lactoferrin receptor protein n=1 Tax=Tropicimonas sediminicola TaxID=1031541 RepID=A0A239LB42_9RHOB|nr:TonB-dependent receptor [Tropicimonas sediminicola]SNT27510.1 hemoglobin/transferrin/lactoferrin receptor protein [Tropicimonas sediminicola]